MGVVLCCFILRICFTQKCLLSRSPQVWEKQNNLIVWFMLIQTTFELANLNNFCESFQSVHFNISIRNWFVLHSICASLKNVVSHLTNQWLFKRVIEIDSIFTSKHNIWVLKLIYFSESVYLICILFLYNVCFMQKRFTICKNLFLFYAVYVHQVLVCIVVVHIIGEKNILFQIKYWDILYSQKY